MAGFSAAWLLAREPVDARSRDRSVSAALRDAFAARSGIDVIDIGCGTGANLRLSAPLLGPRQNWTLLDHDPVLLDAAAAALVSWADAATGEIGRLELRKHGQTIVVRLRQVDLARDLDEALGEKPDLVTASAFFDLVSDSFIDTLAAAVTRRGTAFHATLTYDGRQDWSPRHPADEAIRLAFNAHQMSDKGFGAAAGPLASARLTRALGGFGYRLTEGESPWRLGGEDAALISDLIDGIATAATETRRVDQREIAAWRAVARDGGVIGHVDLLALPKG